MYDISKGYTFASVERWLKELREHADANIVIMLVGNKSDLNHIRQVKREDGSDFAKEQNLAFLETSALEDSNVDQAFEQVLKQIYTLLSVKPIPNGDDDAGMDGPRPRPIQLDTGLSMGGEAGAK